MAELVPNVDIGEVERDSGFLGFLRSLPEKPATTFRFFDRNDYYTVHSSDAEYVCREVFRTMSVLKYLGSGDKKIGSVCLSKRNFEALLVDLLLVKRYRVEVYQNTGAKGNAWSLVTKRLAHLWNLVFLLHRRLQRWVPLWSRILQLQQLFPLLALVHPWIQARQQILATLMSPGLLLLPLALVHPWTQGSLQTLAALPCPGPLLSLAPLRGLLKNFQLLPWLGSRQGHETTSTRP
ncbi:DNA mismatch repair protein Msh2 [Ixodes scapularis]